MLIIVDSYPKATSREYNSPWNEICTFYFIFVYTSLVTMSFPVTNGLVLKKVLGCFLAELVFLFHCI